MDSVKREAIQKLAEEHPEYREFFNALSSRKKGAKQTPLDAFLKSDILPVQGQKSAMRRNAIEFFRELERFSVGKFLIGRRGAKTRFVWSEPIAEIGRAAEPFLQDRENGEDAGPQRVPNAPTSMEGSKKVKHQYFLREDFTVIFELPLDLTKNEAERLSAMIQTLPLDCESKGESR